MHSTAPLGFYYMEHFLKTMLWLTERNSYYNKQYKYNILLHLQQLAREIKYFLGNKSVLK